MPIPRYLKLHQPTKSISLVPLLLRLLRKQVRRSYDASHLQGVTCYLSVFFPAQIENRASPSFITTEIANTTRPTVLKLVLLCAINCRMESLRKFIPTTAKSVAIIIIAMISALPWPKGCSLSSGRLEIQKLNITTT